MKKEKEMKETGFLIASTRSESRVNTLFRVHLHVAYIRIIGDARIELIELFVIRCSIVSNYLDTWTRTRHVRALTTRTILL